MTAVIQEPYVQGVSTRSLDDLVKAMGMPGVSKSPVSRPFAKRPMAAHILCDRGMAEPAP
jgi:transposase-like protein